MKRTLVLGGPGAGKTTRLLAVLEAGLARGVDPKRVAFVSFTNAAVDEARERARTKFNLTDDDLPYFRTLHSLAFRELGLSKSDVLDEARMREIAELTGELYERSSATEDEPRVRLSANSLVTLEQYARATGKTLKYAWQENGCDFDWFRLDRFARAYELFKSDHGIFDFTDMLQRYADANLPPVPVDLAIVDEGQDLSRAQWNVVDRAFASAAELWVAGDDLQSIHRWAGADEDRFLSLPFEREVLPVSHRLSRQVFDFAETIAGRVSRRYEKAWSSSGRDGSVTWINSTEELGLAAGTWLLLARTHAQLDPLVNAAREQGVVYADRGRSSVKHDHVRAIVAHEALRAGREVLGAEASLALEYANVTRELDEGQSYSAAALKYDASQIWHDALVGINLDDREYYLACLRRGEKLTAPPRVRIETIHRAKGTEAENVLLATALTPRTNRGYELDPDAEHRVFYVGATRAINRLYLLEPDSPYVYPLEAS